MVARRGDEAVRIEALGPSADVGLVYRLGSSAPLHAGASGKVILANLPEAEFEAILASGLRPLTSRTVIDSTQLRFETEQIRKLGYSISLEGHTLGVAAIAAPVFDIDGRPVGAVAISGPIGRFNKEIIESLVAPLKESAAEISKLLGHEPCAPGRARGEGKVR
jgi:DNA-binding IclR family transcriptional regulator